MAIGTALIAVTYGLGRYAYGLYVPVLRTEFGLNAGATGSLASAAYAAYGPAIVAAAALTARGRAREAAILAGASATVGTAVIAAAGTPTVLAAGVVIAGASTGLASPPLVALVAAAVPPGAQDRAQSVVNSGTGLGVLVSGPAAVLAADHWRAAWGFFAALSLAVTVGVARTVRAAPRGRLAIARMQGTAPRAPAEASRAAGSVPRAPDPGPRTAAAAGRVRRREQDHPPAADRGWAGAWPGLALATAAAGLGLASSAYWTFGNDLLGNAGTTGAEASAILWSLLGAAGILAATTGHLVNRIRIAPTWAALLVMVAVATAAPVLAPESLPVAVVSALLFGAGYVGLTGVLILWSSRRFPKRAPTAVASAFLLLSFGQVAGAGLVGAVIDTAGWTAAFLGAGATALACAPLAARADMLASDGRSHPGARGRASAAPSAGRRRVVSG